jgi:hypothetical protein
MALLALALSAAILVSGYLLLSPELAEHKEAASKNDIAPRTIRGSDLQVHLGQGQATEHKAMELNGLEREDPRAILTRRTSLTATDYPFVEYNISGRHAAEAVYFIWRTAEDPEKVSYTPLHLHGDSNGTVYTGSHAEWRGRVTEVGLDIYGDLREQPLTITKLIMLPASGGPLLNSIWSEWTAFKGWTQKSAHHLRGSPENGLLSPTLAAAAWSGLALIILAGSNLLKRFHILLGCAGVIFIPWIALDLLWQSNLSAQLNETKTLFAGKNQQEKHLADLESELYQYTSYLKKEVLPQPGVRIFLLHDSPHRTYKRLKAQYYLLPHNVYNYDRFPQKQAVNEGDYILVLGDISGLKFIPESNSLAWGNKSLQVRSVNVGPQGSVYQVMAPDK